MLLVDRGLHKVSLRDPVEACPPGCKGGRGVLVHTPDPRRLRCLRRYDIMAPLLPLAKTSAAAGAGPSSPEVASQESEEEDSEEEDSAEEDSAEEGRFLGCLLEVAGSLIAGESARLTRARLTRDDTGWEAQLAKLRKYRRKHGDCNVPRGWTEDPGLGSWIANQRKYKKLLDRSEPSKGMTAARAAKLEALGFAWELSAATISKQVSEGRRDDAGWEAQLAKLKAYKRKHGDCAVPNSWAEDPRLGRWVGTQRAFKKMLDRGDPSKGMTAARVAKLEALGFAWEYSFG
jgi:hypothetical protein